MTLIIFKKNTTYFEFFFFSFLILGFWLKPNFVLFFENFRFTEGDIAYLKLSTQKKKEIFNESFFVIIIAFIASILSSVFRKHLQIIFIKKETKKISFKKNFVKFYRRNRIRLLFFYVLSLVLINFINIYFNIYSKGLVNNEIPNFIRSFFAWCFNYGISAMTAIYLFVDILIFKEKKFFLLGLFETFISNITIMSRAFFLTFVAYLKGLIDLMNRLKIKYSNRGIILLIFIISFFFVISFIFVEKLRNKNYIIEKENNERILYSQSLVKVDKNFYKKIIKIGVTRWVGIDGLLSVTANDEKSFNLFFRALQEKPDYGQKSFYMKNFFSSFKIESSLNKNLNTVILPGVVAFLYYSGSYLFVFFGMIFFLLLFTFLEILFTKYSNNNNILASIIGFALAWRLSNFGYLPINTIQFIFSFIGTLIIVVCISKLLWKK